MKARNLIDGAMRLIGVLTPGFTLSAEDDDLALETLNDFIKSLSILEGMKWTRALTGFSLVAGQNSYTVGPTGDFIVTSRPTRISTAFLRDSANVDHKINLVGRDDYLAISTKSSSSNWPHTAYYDDTLPNGTLSIYPTPGEVNTLYLDLQEPLTAFASTTVDVTFPDEYKEFLTYQLAIRLAPIYGKQLTAEIVMVAEMTQNNIRVNNLVEPTPSVDSELLHYSGYNYNINEG